MKLLEIPALELPRKLFEAMRAIVAEFAEGHAILVTALGLKEELSTTEAAAALGMSRPTLIKLLESGEMRYRMVGTHRRVPRSEVEAYLAREGDAGELENLRARRLAALREMAEITHAAGEGY